MVISEVYLCLFENEKRYDYNIGDWEWGKPIADKNLESRITDSVSKKYELDKFLELKNPLIKELKK